jgi:hypothetical protein
MPLLVNKKLILTCLTFGQVSCVQSIMLTGIIQPKLFAVSDGSCVLDMQQEMVEIIETVGTYCHINFKYNCIE